MFFTLKCPTAIEPYQLPLQTDLFHPKGDLPLPFSPPFRTPKPPNRPTDPPSAHSDRAAAEFAGQVFGDLLALLEEFLLVPGCFGRKRGRQEPQGGKNKQGKTQNKTSKKNKNIEKYFKTLQKTLKTNNNIQNFQVLAPQPWWWTFFSSQRTNYLGRVAPLPHPPAPKAQGLHPSGWSQSESVRFWFRKKPIQFSLLVWGQISHQTMGK